MRAALAHADATCASARYAKPEPFTSAPFIFIGHKVGNGSNGTCDVNGVNAGYRIRERRFRFSFAFSALWGGVPNQDDSPNAAFG
jgi:hypothetical protein